MSRTLITGATGFIGCRIAELWHAEGRDVLAAGLVRNETEAERADALRRAGVPLVEADLAAGDIAEALHEVETVIHLAAAQHEANVGEEHFVRVNVAATDALLRASERQGVRRFFYASSIGVYGAHEGVIDEDTPLAPDNPYGRSKAAAETAIAGFLGESRHRLAVFIGRIGETYGPWDRRLHKLFAGIAKGRFWLVGRGDNLHQPVYVDDLAGAIDRLLATPQNAGRPLVLAGDEAITTREMCESIARALGTTVSRRHLPMWPLVVAAAGMEATLGRAGIQPPLHRRRLDFFRKSLAFSTEQRRQLLALPPQRSFDEGARITAEWYRGRGWLPGPGARSPAWKALTGS